MAMIVDFVNVSPGGLESSQVVAALAGLRANEARYFKNTYDHAFTVTPAAESQDTVAAAKKRAGGFKLSDGMDVPAELGPKFTFARQKSKLAGTIRGSYFVIKGEY